MPESKFSKVNVIKVRTTSSIKDYDIKKQLWDRKYGKCRWCASLILYDLLAVENQIVRHITRINYCYLRHLLRVVYANKLLHQMLMVGQIRKHVQLYSNYY